MRQDHPALPVTAAQLAATAAAVAQAGARMLHLHVRDTHGKHTLDAGAYKVAIEAVRAQAGEQLFIQCTSEAAGMHTAEQQRRAIYALSGDEIRADGISVSPRELIRAPADLPAAGKLFRRLAARRLLIQYILYSGGDIARYGRLLEQEIIPPGGHSVLLVLGRHGNRQSAPGALRPLVDALRTAAKQPVNWMVCAFGRHEFDCLTEAVTLGGHVRVGFENSLLLKSGQPAADNRQLITQLTESGNPGGRPLANIRQARAALGDDGLGDG